MSLYKPWNFCARGLSRQAHVYGRYRHGLVNGYHACVTTEVFDLKGFCKAVGFVPTREQTELDQEHGRKTPSVYDESGEKAEEASGEKEGT